MWSFLCGKVLHFLGLQGFSDFQSLHLTFVCFGLVLVTDILIDIALFSWIQRECVCSVTWSCLTLCNSMDCRPPGSSVHGILQARMPEWVAISFYRGTSQPRDWTLVSDISSTGRQVLYHYRHRESIGTAWFLFFHYWYSIFPWMQCHFFFWLLLLSSLFSLL